MRPTIKNLSLLFAAGAMGGLIKGLVAWGCGAAGLNALVGSQMAPGLTSLWMYQNLVWGGLWAFLFLLPLKGLSYMSLGVIYSLPQSFFSLMVNMPRLHHGLLGLYLGEVTPVLILFFGFIWGITTALWLKWSRES